MTGFIVWTALGPRYFLIAVKHKWFLMVVGLKLRVGLWRLVTHDWSKFLPWNLWAYGRQFLTDDKDTMGFKYAWLRHCHAHRHHWQHWILFSDRPVVLPMPDADVREMLADWLAAGRVYGLTGRWPDPRNWEWLKKNEKSMLLHAETKNKLAVLITGLQVAADEAEKRR